MSNKHAESNLQPFHVYLHEEGMDRFDETVFLADAEDMEHAIEQARNAYPGCRVNWLSSHGANWYLAQCHAEHVVMDDEGEWGFIIRLDVPEADDDELELDNYSYRVEEWRAGDIVDTFDAPSYQAAREWITREHPAHCQARYSLIALCDLWNELGDTPVTEGGYLDEGFMFFPRGIHREEVWHWFESVNPAFKVGEAGGWIGEDHPYRQAVCTSCQEPAENIIGCPDGAELCSQCFENSNH